MGAMRYSIREPFRLCQIKVHDVAPTVMLGRKALHCRSAAPVGKLRAEPSPELPLEMEVIQQNSFNSSSGSKGKVSYPRSLRLQMSLGLLLTLYTPYILPLMIDIRWVCAFGHTEVVAASSSKQLFTAGLSWMPINSILFVSK